MVAVALYFATLTPSSATPISYVLNPPISAGLTVTGGFTFDAAGPTLDAVNLSVTGGPQPGSYTVPVSAGASDITAEIPSTSDMIVIGFVQDLGSGPDPVSYVAFPPTAQDPLPVFPNFVGEAIPSAIPEPTSVGLLAAALGLFVFARRANFR
jgi:PEP-CTERM motif